MTGSTSRATANAPGRWSEASLTLPLDGGGDRKGSIPGQDTSHKLLHGRHEAVRIERILLEVEGIVPGEHQVILGRSAMDDFLQGLLDAEAPRIGEAAGRVGLAVHPARKAAMAEAAHAVRLILADLDLFLGRDEHEGVVGRLQRLGEALAVPFARAQQVVARHPEALALDPDVELELVIAGMIARKGDLAVGARLEVAEERVAHGR